MSDWRVDWKLLNATEIYWSCLYKFGELPDVSKNMLVVQWTSLNISVVASVFWNVEQRWSVSGNWHVVGLRICGLDVGWMVQLGSRAEQAQSRAVVHSFDSQLAVVSVVADIESTMFWQADKITHDGLLVVIDTIYFFVEKLSKLCALAFVNILIGVRSGVSDKAFMKRFRLRWL